MLQEEIIDMLSFLKPREMEIVSKRFGLDGERPKTLKEIGRCIAFPANEYARSKRFAFGN